MDIIDISLAVKKAIRQLEDSGRVAKRSIHTRETEIARITLTPNEEMGGFSVARVEGTLGLKPTDIHVAFVSVGTNGTVTSIANSDGKNDGQPVTSPLWYGNLGLVGMDTDTGYPLCICVDFENNASLIISSYTHSVEVDIKAVVSSETIVPIDPKYLPDESVTETINLAAFTTTENTDFNTVLLLSMLESAQSGGALQPQTVHDAGNALRTACSVGNRIVLKATVTLDGHPVFVEFPTMRSMEGGVAAQLSWQSLLYLEGTVLDAQALLVFLRETDNVVVYVKATPLT